MEITSVYWRQLYVYLSKRQRRQKRALKQLAQRASEAPVRPVRPYGLTSRRPPAHLH